MNISQLRKRVLEAGVAIPAIALLGAGFSTPVYAQDDAEDATTCDPATDANCEAAESGEPGIVVTGSRIRRPNLESTVPISSIAGDQFFAQGDSNVGETLNELPQLRSTFSQQNPGLGIGIAGLNLLDLRGLGTARTLVLVNGRRHVGSDILSNASIPDVNTIPNDLIERVDIVTGGNSSVYGSDAIAGVVNFVLRRNYDGLQLRGQAGVSPRGFGGNQYVSAMYGHNFDDGRGNITLHAEYSNQERVYGSELPWLRSVDTFATVDIDPGGLPNGSDGIPDAIFLRDLRSASIHRYGLVPINQPFENLATGPAEARCGVGAIATNGATSNVGGAPYNCTYIFGANGALNAQTGSRYGAGIIGGILGGNGQTGRENDLLSIQPEVKRYNVNLLAHYTISDAFEPFIEAKFVRVDAVGGNASPSFIQGTFGTMDFRERVRLDNPFLTPAQRTEIANLILLSGCNTSLTANCANAAGNGPGTRSTTSGQGTGGPLNAADIAAINAGTYRFVVSRTFSDVANRDEVFQRDTYRIVGGLRGSFNDDWSYEASLNYGRFQQDVFTNGFLDRQRLMLSLDAGRNPVTGAIQCRSQFDPAAAVAYDTGAYQTGGASRANPSQATRLAADIAACVPYNPFGGANNDAAVNYFQVHSETQAEIKQFVVNAFVSGDLSQLFELPGGPIRFAFGGEYREDRAEYLDDVYHLQGYPNAATNTNNVVIGNFTPEAAKVKEAFAEIQIPLLADLPFVEELTLSGAARYADYSGASAATGGVWAYNAGIDWAPVRDIRFRGNYSRAVRAPNLSELYFPVVANFAPGFVDPCSPNALANNPNRPANCLAQMGGNAAILAAQPNVTYSLPVLSGSNPFLTAETSISWTVGAVAQPRWIPGLALSVDYYNIEVEDVIVSLGAQAIANNCVDQPTTANVFCGLFTRYLGPTPGALGETQGQIQGNTLLQAGVNFASRKRRGIDVNLSYRTNIADDWALNANLIYTHNFQISNFENPALPDFENRILGELGDPKNEARLDIDVKYGDFTFGYRARYIGKMFTSLYENFRPLDTACAGTGASQVCPPNNLDVIGTEYFPSTFYHDIRLEYDINNEYMFYLGLDNALDTHPPLGQTGTGGAAADRGGGQSAIYDAFGRKVYAGFRVRM